MRLFTAINFNVETQKRLIILREELRSRSQHGNFTHDENLHLTLAFIGEVSPKKVDTIKAILDTVELEPFPATIRKLGTFSRGSEEAQSVATWWAGLQQDKALMLLQHEIAYKFAIGGFAMDGRAYHPHITLGREIVTDSKPWQIDPISEVVSTIDLMKSERMNGKLTYTSIHKIGK